MKSYVCKPILMTLLSLAVSLGTLLPMRSMVYFCQSVFLKICFVIALDVLRDLPTVDTITIESPVSSTNTLLINPSSTTSDGISFQTSILSFTTSNAHSTFTVSETTTHYEPSSGVSSDHSTLLPSFSTSKVSSLFMSTATTPYLSTLHPSSQRSTLSSESIRYSTTIDIHSSSHASHMPTISTNAMSPVVSSLTFSSTVSSAHSTASFSSSQTLPVTSVTVSGSYLTTPSTEGITTSMISPKVSSTSVDTYSTTSLRMQSSISFVSNTSPTTASTTAETSTLGAIKDANNDGLVLGLSIGLSVAVVAIVCLLIVVIFWKRCGHRKALDTRTETSPKSKCCAVSKISTVENYTRAYKDNCRVFGEHDISDDAGIVNPVFVLYEENPDFNFV